MGCSSEVSVQYFPLLCGLVSGTRTVQYIRTQPEGEQCGLVMELRGETSLKHCREISVIGQE